jgi:mono/diheme cytochrome c family protein
MISHRMSRPARVLIIICAIAVSGLTAACGTEKIALSPANPLYHGAVLFNQRCGGCHTLSYAATNGSASNVRSAMFNNGPNFNVRCERPVTRVLYAIANGGFSGAIMPQNIVVGQDAIEVAKFVATYAGRQAPQVSGVPPCVASAIGSIPAVASAESGSAVPSSSPAATAATGGSAVRTAQATNSQKARARKAGAKKAGAKKAGAKKAGAKKKSAHP